jgi:hypothetical protein
MFARCLAKEPAMRKSVLLLIFAFAVSAAFMISDQSFAAGVKLTQQQVKDTCGKKLQSGGGAMGCEKQCGLNGEHLCTFGCYKGQCSGECLNCGVKARGIFRGQMRANWTVRGAVKASP